MKANHVIILCAGLCSLVVGCAPVPYATVGQNVPLFHQKGEYSLTGAYGETNDAHGLSIQAAASVHDHWAITSSYYSLVAKTNGDAEWRGRGSYVEFGAGNFGRLGTRKHLVYEAMAGIGFGKIENYNETSTADVRFVKPFIQPSIGYTSKWFDAAFTPRLVIISFSDFNYNSPDPAEQDIIEQMMADEKTNVAFEPGFTVRTGYKGLKLQLQLNFSTFSPWDDDDVAGEVNVNDTFLSVGLNYQLTRRYKE
jgi:hypothetical protein